MTEMTATSGPAVSVIIPTCNRTGSLKEALSSVFAQTFKNFEIVLVNDGGKDISPLLRLFESSGQIVYLEHEKNRGVAATRNTAIKAARGTYIAYLDDDDIYYPEHLETLISYLETGSHKVAYTDSHQEFLEWITDRYVSKGKKAAFGVDFDRQKLLIHNYIPTLNIAHQRDLLNETGLFDESLETHEDWDLWIRLSQKCDFHHIPKITAAFRTTSGPEKSASADRVSILKSMQAIYDRYAKLIDHPAHIEERRRAEHSLALEIAWNMPPHLIKEYTRSHRYALAMGFVEGKKVLDLGCGDGKRTSVIAQKADSVLGVDPRPGMIKRATSRYAGENLSFLTGFMDRVPIPDNGCFDLVLCFSELLSIEAWRKLLLEVKRLIKPDGLFLSAVTNFAFPGEEKSWTKEAFQGGLYLNDFRSLLSDHFQHVHISGQGIFTSSEVFALSGSYDSTRPILMKKDASGFLSSILDKEQAHSFFAISTDIQIEERPLDSHLIDVSNTLMEHQQSLGEELRDELTEQYKKRVQMESTVDQNKLMIANLQNSLHERDSLVMQLQSALQQRDPKIADLQSTLIHKNEEITKLNYTIDQKERELENLQSAIRSKDKEFGELELHHKQLESHHQQIESHHHQIFQQQEAHLISLMDHLNGIQKSRWWKLLQVYTRLKAICYIKPHTAYNKFIQHVRMEGMSSTLRRTWAHSRASEKKNEGSPGSLELPTAKTYGTWISLHRPSSNALLRQSQEVLEWKDRPLISLIIPVYNTRAKWLQDLLASISAQTYDRWEAFLVDDHSSSSSTLAVLTKQCEKDERFKLIKRSRNGGVAAACQDGLEAASGVFAVVVDHDDILEPNALYHIVSRSRSEPAADVIYSDEALTDEIGNIYRVVFRPRYSYYRLLSHPYIVHLTAFRRSIALSVGGFDLSFQVSQDYDLLLRIAAVTNRFSHIPRVLYLWRQHHESTGHRKINEVMANSTRALQRHLNLKEIKGAVAQPGLSFNFFRVRYPIKSALISVIIPTRDRVDFLRRCISSFQKKTELPDNVRHEIVIADNDSKEEETLAYFRELEEDGHLVVPCRGFFNFSRINNMAARVSRGDVFLFLNNDIEVVEPGWLQALLEIAQLPETGAVGAKLVYPDGLIQHAGVIIGINQHAAGHSHQFFPEKEYGQPSGGHLGDLLCIRESMAVTAACLMVRREVFEKVGGFNEEFTVGFGDTDLCLRIREAGFMNLWTPYARLIHYESASRGKRGDAVHLHPEDMKRFKDRWKHTINQGDPYHNPNLSLDSNNFSPKN